MGLNENIKKYRLARGISQVELAGKLGITKQCVSNWENDNIQPSVDMLIKLARFFRVSTDDLLGLSDSDKTVIEGKLTEDQAAHVRAIVSELEKGNLKN